MEWKDKYNAFNSMKVLCWRDRFEALLNGEIPKPVSATVDSMNLCNINCKWCHYGEYRKNNPDVRSTNDLIQLAELLPQLGLKSVCLAGGGEFLMHPYAGEFMQLLKDKGIEVSLITNGTLIHNFLDEILHNLRWIGISVDVACSDTYRKLKGKNMFSNVISNIQTLVESRDKYPSIGFKFLIHPDNYNELFEAAKLAKQIGVDDFHIRPCYLPGLKWDIGVIDKVKKNIALAQELEDSRFHVYGVTHKFDNDFNKKVVDKCEITPIAGLTFSADGYSYVCCLPEGTRIDTKGGIKSIEQVKKGDYVLTHKSRYKKVKRTFKRTSEELVYVNSYGWFEELVATPEHPILAVKKRDRYCGVVGKHCPVLPDWKHCIGCTKHKEFNPKFIPIKDLELEDYVFTPIDRTENYTAIDLMMFSKEHNKQKLKYTFDRLILNEELCWLIGLYIAEGNILKSRKNLSGLVFSLGINDLPFIPKLEKIITKNFGLSPKISVDGNRIIVQIFSVILADIFKEIVGEYSDKKQLQNLFMTLPIKLQEQLLWGWCDGDGFHRTRDNTYHITTTSKELICQMWKICLRCGYSATTYDWKILADNRKQAYTLFLSPDKYRRGKVFLWENYLVSQIKNIIFKKENKTVYNIEIEEDNSYIANSIAVHNCDLRGEEMGRLCKWNEILDVWGSDRHKKILQDINPKKCPYRCTYNAYQEILDKVFREDKMCYRFP